MAVRMQDTMASQIDRIINPDKAVDRIDALCKTGIKPFSQWVVDHYRFRTGVPFTFDGHWFLKPLYDTWETDMVIQKAAQMGLSEWLYATGFYLLLELRLNVFHGFPTFTQLQDEVQTRVNQVILSSPYIYKKIAEDKDSVNNVNLKTYRGHSIKYRGTQNQRQIITAAADAILKDELDQWMQAAIRIIEKRLDASEYKLSRAISTPTLEDAGINREFKRGTQHHYMHKCPHCNNWQIPDIKRNVVKLRHKGVRYICENCGRVLKRTMPGEYVAKYPKRSIKSYSVSGIVAPRKALHTSNGKGLYDEFQRILRGELSEKAIEDFWGQGLGLTYDPPDARLTNQILHNARGEHKNGVIPQGCVLGIDVGGRLHMTFAKVQPDGVRHLYFRTITKKGNNARVELLMDMVKEYNISFIVIDSMPDGGLVNDLIQALPGRVAACEYVDSKNKKPIKRKAVPKESKYRVDRVDYMDDVRRYFKNRLALLPADITQLHEVIPHMKAPKRKIEMNEETGDQFPTYKHTEPDHYYHSTVYAHVAADVFEGTHIDFDIGVDVNESEQSKAEKMIEYNRKKMGLQARLGEYYDIIATYEMKHGVEPDDEEIIAKMKITDDEYNALLDIIYSDATDEAMPGMGVSAESVRIKGGLKVGF